MIKLVYIKNYFLNYLDNTKFFSIFLIKPLPSKDWTKISYSKSHLHKGENYHKKFTILPGRKIIWELEKKLIIKFLKKYIKKKNHHLDFASGSGRISKLLEKYFKLQNLIYSSKKILNFDKIILPNSKIINKDFRNIKLLNKKFDLITAFRFFPNAEPDLRKKAMIFISKHLKKNGILIFNNHRNFWSFPYFMRRVTFRSDGFGMTHSEVLKLLDRCDLEILETKSIGILTDKEKGYLINWKIIKILENFFYKKFNFYKIGYNVIYVVKNKKKIK